MNKAKIAIIIVNYNGLMDTIECIESIKNSTIKAYVVVVDNKSKKNEAEQIAELFSEDIVHTIRSEENGGFSAGNNIGIRWAIDQGYKYIMLLNNDTVIAPNMIQLLLQYALDNAVSVPKMLYYSKPNVIWYGGGNINPKTGNAEHLQMNMKDSEETTVQQCDFATGCCIMIPTSVLKKVGLLEERYFMYCEDSEFCLRMKEQSIAINYVPNAMLWHKISQSTGGDDSAFSIYYMSRNRILYIKAHKNIFWPTALPFTVVTRFIRMAQLILKGKSEWKAFAKGVFDGIRGVDGKVEI